MQVTHLEPNQVPAILRGNYSGRTFKAEVCESATLTDTYWSGGTRSTYRMIELATGKATEPNGIAAPHHFGGTLEGKTVPVSPGFVLVEHVIFCGKDHGLRFYVNPADTAKLLPAPTSELSDDEKTVLAATAGLKSSYGGIPNFRFHEASRSTGITLERWDAAKASCISKGFLNKAGAITTQGRNAVGSYRLR